MILDIYATLMTMGVIGFATYVDVRLTPLRKRVNELEKALAQKESPVAPLAAKEKKEK